MAWGRMDRWCFFRPPWLILLAVGGVLYRRVCTHTNRVSTRYPRLTSAIQLADATNPSRDRTDILEDQRYNLAMKHTRFFSHVRATIVFHQYATILCCSRIKERQLWCTRIPAGVGLLCLFFWSLVTVGDKKGVVWKVCGVAVNQ